MRKSCEGFLFVSTRTLLISYDNDGNLLISSRHLDEITKINRTTGSIIWRLGGKNNQFAFPNDSLGFSHQHAIRRIGNENILLFDNGNFRGISGSQPDTTAEFYSRAVESTRWMKQII